MQIKIITTEKKLTKALINQMLYANSEIMQKGNVLGYIINAKKDSYKIILIEYKSDYYIIETDWSLGKLGVFRRSGRYTQTKESKNNEDKHIWWKNYQKVLVQAKTHIYI